MVEWSCGSDPASRAAGSLVCGSVLKASSMQPQACLDLLYLDLIPRISPVCLPWNAATDSNSSLEQRGIIWKRVAKSTRRLAVIPLLLWPLWFAVRSMHQRPAGDCRMLALIKHLGACVFGVRSQPLKEITYGEEQWGTLPFWCNRVSALCCWGGGWSPFRAPRRPYLTLVSTQRT